MEGLRRQMTLENTSIKQELTCISSSSPTDVEQAPMADALEHVKAFMDCAGLDGYQAKTCIYYAAATHKLGRWNWFPMLEIIGPTGTGKSSIIKLLGKLCFNPAEVPCKGISTAALRDELDKARGGTVLAEEADEAQSLRQAESLFAARCDKATSRITIKERLTAQTEQSNTEWIQVPKDIFGATVLHHRQPFLDQSSQNRAISIHTRLLPGNFEKPENITLRLPTLDIAPILDYSNIAGRVLDTWRPLLSIASWAGDSDWLNWAQRQMEEAGDELKDGHNYEPAAIILARVIEALTDNEGNLNLRKLKLETAVTRPLRHNSLPWLTPQQVTRTLTKLGLMVERRGGTNWLYPTHEALKKAAEKIGYEDGIL